MSNDEWTDAGYFHGGTSFGDGQVGEDHTHRYTRPHPKIPGYHLVVTVSYAAIDPVEADNHDEDDYPEGAPRYYVAERWDYTECTDLDDIGMTEVWSDLDYGEGSTWSYLTPEAADREAAAVAQTDDRPYIMWDGGAIR